MKKKIAHTASKYRWPHLQRNEVRREHLFKALKRYLHPKDHILDICCGYSPLAKLLLDSGCDITGFDVFEDCIKHLRRILPKGRWMLKSFKKVELYPYSVLLFLGLPGDIGVTKIFNKFLTNILSVEPRIILMDTAVASKDNVVFKNGILLHIGEGRWQKIHNYTIKAIVKQGFKIIDFGFYANPVEHTWKEDDFNRLFIVLKRQVVSSSEEYMQLCNNFMAYSVGLCRARNLYLVRMMRRLKRPPKRIVEFACAYGWLAKTILRFCDVKKYLCTNFNPSVINCVRNQNIEGLEVDVVDAYDAINYPDRFEEFDTFVCTSLEHLERDIEFVKAIPSGAHFLFSVSGFGGPTHFRHFRDPDHVRSRYKDLLEFKEVVGVKVKNRSSRKFAACTVRR